MQAMHVFLRCVVRVDRQYGKYDMQRDMRHLHLQYIYEICMKSIFSSQN